MALNVVIVCLPVIGHYDSFKVKIASVIVVGSISSLKVAVTLLFLTTEVAVSTGVVEMMAGAVVSALFTGLLLPLIKTATNTNVRENIFFVANNSLFLVPDFISSHFPFSKQK